MGSFTVSFSALFSVVLSIALSFPIHAQAATPVPSPELLEAVKRIRRVGLGCPDRVWPGYSLTNTEIYFVYSKSKTAFKWDSTADTLTAFDFESLTPQMQSSIYAMDSIDKGGVKIDRLSMGIDVAIEMNPQWPFQEIVDGFVFHEMFHHHGQEGWAEGVDSPRGTLMPMDANPRYYRAMAELELKAALASPEIDFNHLGAAKTWIKKWQNEYPVEATNYTDLIESTARYVEIQSIAIAQLGCHATDAELLSVYMSQNPPFDPENVYLSLDGESYTLGNLAILLLKKLGVERDYAQKIAKGASPLDLLFEAIDAKNTTDDSTILNAITQTADKENTEFFSAIDSTLKLLESKSGVRLIIDHAFLRGNFSPKGFYLYAVSEDPDVSWAPFARDHEFKTADETLSLTAKTGAVSLNLATSNQGLSERGGFTFFIERAEVKGLETVTPGAQAVFEIHSPLIQGRIKGVLKTGVNGELMIVAQAPAPSDPKDPSKNCDDNLK